MACLPFAGRPFGPYELLEEIARGGMGVVYRARQISLNRIVAVKMILAGHFAGPDSIRRFRAEAAAAARLCHPNIIAVHEVGEHDGQQYFSMEYVQGRNLADAVRDKPMGARRAAALVRTIAEAIHYAHGQGVLHRDIKPSNILLDADDRPHVTDFGLAKRMQSAEGGVKNNGPTASDSAFPTLHSSLTLSGQVLGSPNYISPEQASGKRGTVGPATDVYGLGAVLCHLLTGRAPFVGDTVTDLLQQVLDEEPISPRLLNPSVSRDLETICLKCLEKEQSRRYASAKELADELDRFLRNEPIHARPAGRWEKVWRWSRRQPVLAGSFATILVLLLTVSIGSPIAAYQIRQQRERAETEAAHARASDQQTQASLRQAETNLWESYLAQAHARRLSDQSGRRYVSLEVLKKAAGIRPSLELRNEAIACLALRDVRRATEEWEVMPRGDVLETGPNFYNEQTDASGERFVWAGTNGIVQVRRLSDGHELLALPGFPTAGVTPSFDPTGRFLVIDANRFDGQKRDGTKTHFKVVDLERGHVIYSNTVTRASRRFISRDGLLLAMIHGLRSNACFVGIYSLGSGTLLQRIELHDLSMAVSFHPQKDTVAVGLRDGQVEVWDWRKIERLHSLKLPELVTAVDWHPEGKMLAVGCVNGRIYMCQAEHEQVVTIMLGDSNPVGGVRFSRAGDSLASCSLESGVQLWNPSTGQPIVRIDGTPNSSFSQDDHWIGCMTRENHCGRLELLPIREFSQWALGEGQQIGSFNIEWSPDGRWLLSACYSKASLWDAASGKELASLPCGTPAARIHPSGESLLVCSRSGLKLWPLSTQADEAGTQLTLGPPQDLLPDVGVDFISFDKTGRTLALNGDGRTYRMHQSTSIRFFDLATRQGVRQLQMESGAYGFALSRDGRWCAGWPYLGYPLRVWNLASGEPVKDLAVSSAEGTAFTPDGNILISQEKAGCVAWETGTWRRLYSFPISKQGSEPLCATFTSDGRMAAVRYHQSSVRLFDPTTGRELATLEPPEPLAIDGLVFSPDGTRLAAVTAAASIEIWELRAIRQRLATMNLDWDMPSYPPASTSTPSGALQVTVLDATNAPPVHPSLK